MFRALMLIIRRSKLHYTASGIITSIGGRLVHKTATYTCDDTRGCCVMEFWPPDDEHKCSKHVEAWNKLIVKQNFCASSWLITEINICSDSFLTNASPKELVEFWKEKWKKRNFLQLYVTSLTVKVLKRQPHNTKTVDWLNINSNCRCCCHVEDFSLQRYTMSYWLQYLLLSRHNGPACIRPLHRVLKAQIHIVTYNMHCYQFLLLFVNIANVDNYRRTRLNPLHTS